MKTGIMTWFTYHNYGTALQLTALSDKIKSLGHDTVLINYSPRPLPADKENEHITAKFIVKDIARFIAKRINSYDGRIYNVDEREEKFEDFIGKNISLTAECNTQPELEDIAGQLDAVICGSDQIWSPLCYDPHYFLDFVHDHTKKIAYAPSIDPSHIISKTVKDKIIDMAGDIDYVSVREHKAASAFSQWLNKDVKTTLDPALLLDAGDWEKYIPDEIRNNMDWGGGVLSSLYAWAQ